jgi:hypothetical protein
MSLPTDAAQRKATPIATGFCDYFPDAMVAVAQLSKIGNDQHNPGQVLHWEKSKSTDHADCIMRHLIERGTLDVDGVLHSAKVAWRAMALLQIELEAAAKVEKPKSMLDLLRLHSATEQRLAHNADPTTRHGGQPIRPESRFGFMVGETVNLKVSEVGQNPGIVHSFNDDGVNILWNQSTDVSHGWYHKMLRHGA